MDDFTIGPQSDESIPEEYEECYPEGWRYTFSDWQLFWISVASHDFHGAWLLGRILYRRGASGGVDALEWNERKD